MLDDFGYYITDEVNQTQTVIYNEMLALDNTNTVIITETYPEDIEPSPSFEVDPVAEVTTVITEHEVA